MKPLTTTCAIVGGGPCGMMLGVLLARAGVDVTVLEKYPDFFRDFRGDTIHPSTLNLLYELGWLDDFLKIPHQELQHIGARINGEYVEVGDFTHLPTHCKFVALMPQWDFLNFLAERGKRYPTFRLLMKTEGTDLVITDGRVTGVIAKDDAGSATIDAKLVVGTDGRHSTMRERAGLHVEDFGAPMDVLWMRISKHADDPVQPLGSMRDGRILVMIDRNEYWQCAFLIPKGTFEQLKAAGVEALHRDLVEAVPQLQDRVNEIDDWSKVSLLEVVVDRLKVWHRPGLLCIGDAAHAMSPIGGVGVNLAVQDAVAAANALAAPLLAGDDTEAALAQIQSRRMFPTKVTQAFQVFVQQHAIMPVLGGKSTKAPPPLIMRLFDEFPRLRGLPARLIGMGVRPENVHTPDAFSSS
ncbi:MAG TPA: FAD-dependent oxidoreductase [Candidatus Tumulicola sp.]|jgi:2-polyprenyl-6-methoxyphenol hydroxylase-like FAD-dependent oxidoreductase